MRWNIPQPQKLQNSGPVYSLVSLSWFTGWSREMLPLEGDLICCISNSSDFWRIISLSLSHDYKEVTVLKLEPLQLQLTKQVMQTLLDLCLKQFFHQCQHFYHFQTFSHLLRALGNFLHLSESKMKTDNNKNEPHPTLPKKPPDLFGIHHEHFSTLKQG